MSLIKCTECNNNVSSLAKTCPHCGVPISDESYLKENSETTTIQLTSKNLKIQELISWIVIFVGTSMAILSCDSTDAETVFNISFFVILIGVAGLMITRFQVWWYHK